MPPAAPSTVRRREIFGWCCFDFANSSYTTVVITVVYAVYFAQVVAQGDPAAAGWWGTTLALAQLAVLLISPWIGAYADLRAAKKRLLALTAGVCSAGAASLALVGPGEITWALAIVFAGTAAFYLGENLCAAFLPEISTPETVGRISGYGWSVGYCGGLLSLVLALAMIEGMHWPVPWVFAMSGVFFALASLPTLLLLRERAYPRAATPECGPFRLAWQENLRAWREITGQRELAWFFGSLFCGTAGLTAVVAFASLFAHDALGMERRETILLFIVLQVAGVAGAWGFGVLLDRIGPKLAHSVSLAIWTAVCIAAALCHDKVAFYAIAVAAGIALGGYQAGGRAVVALFTPEGRGGEYFGYWGFFGKLAGVVGQPVFGWLATAVGYRAAILANAVFFLAGLALLLPLRLPRSNR